MLQLARGQLQLQAAHGATTAAFAGRTLRSRARGRAASSAAGTAGGGARDSATLPRWMELFGWYGTFAILGAYGLNSRDQGASSSSFFFLF